IIPYIEEENAKPGHEFSHFRIRLDNPTTKDGKEFRWCMPSGNGIRPYILPWLPKETWQNKADPILIVEGPPKALSTYGNTKILTIALGGVETAHDKDALEAGIERLHPEILALCDWKGREVIICMDSNRATKAGVLRG